MASERADTEHGAVSLLRDGSPDADRTIVLAPGAGADMHHAFMAFAAEGLAARGFHIVRFNFLYQESGKKAPDRQPILEATYRGVLDALGVDVTSTVLGGKSMGARIASHLAADGMGAAGLLFLGYPLHPPGRPDRIRDAHLRDVDVPMLFIEGTRDPFCPLDTLESVRSGLRAKSHIAVIDDGDHSFKVRRVSGRSTEQAWQEVVDAAADWVDRL